MFERSNKQNVTSLFCEIFYLNVLKEVAFKIDVQNRLQSTIQHVKYANLYLVKRK